MLQRIFLPTKVNDENAKKEYLEEVKIQNDNLMQLNSTKWGTSYIYIYVKIIYFYLKNQINTLLILLFH
jgi:hypothetical protein